ncbi:hypothetical protein K504DRAFT_8813 [Pleomassaria siparia CBS 279.74]|uniref:Uncharacterized protein n=1 Tax=Pleomassaria siparia CBS 279.74 TaxID=1314801 RepID=A0A6G1KPE6_9PLEO|nr:hypothetical protein K504DRAFT_8813 [Pleomassaria siparia CBS 279.74]
MYICKQDVNHARLLRRLSRRGPEGEERFFWFFGFFGFWFLADVTHWSLLMVHYILVHMYCTVYNSPYMNSAVQCTRRTSMYIHTWYIIHGNSHTCPCWTGMAGCADLTDLTDLNAWVPSQSRRSFHCIP